MICQKNNNNIVLILHNFPYKTVKKSQKQFNVLLIMIWFNQTVVLQKDPVCCYNFVGDGSQIAVSPTDVPWL